METVVVAEDSAEAEALPLRPLWYHLLLSVYWLGNSLMWGVLLHLGLQSRLTDWFDEATVGFWVPLVGGIGAIVGATAQVVVGPLSDRAPWRWGRRRPYVLVGSLAAAGALLLFGMARSYWPFLGGLLLVQFTSNIALGPYTALLPDTVNRREQGLTSGFMGVFRLVGDMGGLFLASVMLNSAALRALSASDFLLARDHQWWALCAWMAVLLAVCGVVTCVGVREKPLARRPEGTVWEVIRSTFDVDLRGNPDFAWLTLSRAVTNIGLYMFLQLFMFYVKYTLREPNPEDASRTLLLPAIIAAGVISWPAGWLSDRVGRKPLVYASQGLLALGALVYAVAPSRTWVLWAGVPAGLAYGAFTAVEWAFGAALVPRKAAAKYLAFWNLSAVLPQVLATPIGGPVGSALSKYGGGLGWRVDFGIAVVLCIVGAYFLKHVREHPPGPEASAATGLVEAS
jgi:MFS family permease